MATYSYEFKKKVVMSYLKGEGGYSYIAKIYGIPTLSLFYKVLLIASTRTCISK